MGTCSWSLLGHRGGGQEVELSFSSGGFHQLVMHKLLYLLHPLFD